MDRMAGKIFRAPLPSSVSFAISVSLFTLGAKGPFLLILVFLSRALKRGAKKRGNEKVEIGQKSVSEAAAATMAAEGTDEEGARKDQAKRGEKEGKRRSSTFAPTPSFALFLWKRGEEGNPRRRPTTDRGEAKKRKCFSFSLHSRHIRYSSFSPPTIPHLSRLLPTRGCAVCESVPPLPPPLSFPLFPPLSFLLSQKSRAIIRNKNLCSITTPLVPPLSPVLPILALLSFSLSPSSLISRRGRRGTSGARP